MYSVGIDIGGTYIKCGLVKAGKLVIKDKVATPKENNEKLIINTISTLVDGLLEKIKATKEDI